MTTSQKKRRCLLAYAREGMTLDGVNDCLVRECLESINAQEWHLWSTYFVNIVKDDPYFEHELLANDRSLSWFAHEINSRRNKVIIS